MGKKIVKRYIYYPPEKQKTFEAAFPDAKQLKIQLRPCINLANSENWYTSLQTMCNQCDKIECQFKSVLKPH